jgi:hypothetical protein
LLKKGADGLWLGVGQPPEITYYAESCCHDRNRCQSDDTTGADNFASARPKYHFGSVAMPRRVGRPARPLRR